MDLSRVDFIEKCHLNKGVENDSHMSCWLFDFCSVVNIQKDVPWKYAEKSITC